MEDINIRQWSDKYRPLKINKLIHQDNIVNLFFKIKNTKQMPNLLLYGPPGTGKTSSIKALARELFNEFVPKRVLELNASDKRGIDVVRTTIIEFAEKSINIIDDLPNFKIIILDEADEMTPEAQHALRKIMEDNIGTTRFCLTCNSINNILNPIVSRCTKYRFKPIPQKIILQKLLFILKKERILIPQNLVEFISSLTNGDLRKSINVIQKLKYTYIYKQSLNQQLNLLDVCYSENILPFNYLINIIKIIVNPNTSIEKIYDLSNYIIKNCYIITNILSDLNKYFIYIDIDEEIKCLVLIKFSFIEKNFNNSSNELLQLCELFSFINDLFS